MDEDSGVVFAFDSTGKDESGNDDTRTIGDLIDAVNNNWGEWRKLNDPESIKTTEQGHRSETPTDKNTADILESLRRMQEHISFREDKADSEKLSEKAKAEEEKEKQKSVQTPKPPAAPNHTVAKPEIHRTPVARPTSPSKHASSPMGMSSRPTQEESLLKFSRVNVSNLEDVFRKLNMGRVVQNLSAYTSSINKYVDGMNTVIRLGSSMFSSFNSRLSANAASNGLQSASIRAAKSDMSNRAKSTVQASAKQAVDKVLSSIPSSGATAGSDADSASQQIASELANTTNSTNSQSDVTSKIPDLANKVSQLRKATSRPIQNSTVEDASSIAKGAGKLADATKMADGAASAGGAVADAAVADAAGGAIADAAGSGIGSILTGAVTKLNPWIAGATAVGAIAKAGMDEYRETNKMGNQYGGGASTGWQMQMDNGKQDMAKFFGLTSVSGKQLDSFRQSAGNAGLTYGSEAYDASVELKKQIADSGLPQSMTNLADRMLLNGASADMVKDQMDSLKETSKATGQSLQLITDAASKASGELNKIGGKNEGVKTASEAQENVRDVLKDSGMMKNPSAKTAESLISNKSFISGLQIADPTKIAQLNTETGRYEYLSDPKNDDKIQQAYQTMMRLNSMPGSDREGSQFQQNLYWMNADRLSKSGLTQYADNVDKAMQYGWNESEPKSTEPKKPVEHKVKVDVSLDNGLMAKVNQQNEDFKRLYSGSDSMEIGK